jgi:hypothetical protein
MSDELEIAQLKRALREIENLAKVEHDRLFDFLSRRNKTIIFLGRIIRIAKTALNEK